MYPGGGGGNHVSNLLSTIDGFEKRFPSTDYLSNLRDGYLADTQSGSFYKVHLFRSNQMDCLMDDPINHRQVLDNNTKTNILHGHWACYQTNLINDAFVDLADCVWLIVSWPSVNSLPKQRIDKYRLRPQQPEQYSLPLYFEKIITPDTSEFILLADETNGFVVEIEKLFSLEGWDYLNNTLQEQLGISLPIASKELHQFWIDSITQDVQ
jgi:hypothetical protein